MGVAKRSSFDLGSSPLDIQWKDPGVVSPFDEGGPWVSAEKNRSCRPTGKLPNE